MKVILLSNETKPNIYTSLHDRLHKDDILRVRLAVAYLMEKGAHLLEKDFKGLLAKKIPVEIIFTDDWLITESAALQNLLDIGCSLSIFRSIDKRPYHPKVWIIDCTDGNYAISVGSSNLSDTGLLRSVEACVLLEGTQLEVQSYLDLWQSIECNSQKIDQDFIDTYKDMEKQNKIKFRIRPNGKPDHSANYQQLEEFVNEWMHYIESPEIQGRTEKWRGWYLLPSQGEVNIKKLAELGRVIRAIEKVPQYHTDRYIDISSSKQGVKNVNSIIKSARITYASKHTKRYVRALFVRQQKNYLAHLGFINEPRRSRIQLTDRGVELGAAIDDAEMRDALSRSVMNISWPHGNIYFFPFMLELLDKMPDGRIYEDELDLFVIHTYNNAQLDNRREILTMYRSLPHKKHLDFYKDIQGKLHSLLIKHRNTSAYGHYKGKIRELMIAFGNTAELKFVQRTSAQKSYLTRRS